ncbi:endonuclease III [Oxyplasma meridianum]|uniref:Endonuclease III n=1 Tax=Oxyplasma meridianum TaxID=3073602 RepID=A0AAX4NEU1_9ARCH
MKITDAKRNFGTIYDLIKSMSPPHHFEFSDPFWVLVTTLLSHRTKDQVTDAAARSLYNRYGTAEKLASASYDDVLSLILKVGFCKVKATRVIQLAGIIVNRYGGRVPESREELMSIPGVGRKTANVVLSDSMNIPAIAVDTHVQRISKRIGWSKYDNPEKTEEVLMKIVPKDEWVGFNPVMVEFGKTICRPIGPKCSQCLINKYCDFYAKNKR